MGIRGRSGVSLWLAVGVLVILTAALSVQAAQGTGKTSRRKGDLVVLDHERWLDTLKGTVKNFSQASARDVTVVVRFLDKKKNLLGTQRVSVGDLRSGEQSAWSLAIQEKNRPARSYQFEVHAIWQ